jgi:hypothetical protein
VSDFLTRIIERAENRAAVLQRRPLALFEMAPISSAVPVASAVDSDRDERVEAHSSVVAPERSLLPEPARSPLGPIAQTGSDADVSRADRTSRRPSDSQPREERRTETLAATRRPPLASIARVPEQASRIVTRPTDAHVEHRPVERDRERDRARVESATAPAVKQGRDELTPARHEQRPSSLARLELAERAPARATSADSKNLTQPAAPRPTTVPTKQRSTTAVMLAKAQSAKSPPPPAIPVPAPVHISIGRIEVRATSASQSPPRPATQSGPRLKLDDYLSDRSRSRR